MKIKNLQISKNAKKKILAGALIVTMAASTLVLGGCGNKVIFDTQYTFHRAVVVNGDKAMIVEIDKWNDYDGEQLQIKTKEGLVFLVNSNNIYPIDENDSNIEAENFARGLVGEDGEVSYLNPEKNNSKSK